MIFVSLTVWRPGYEMLVDKDSHQVDGAAYDEVRVHMLDDDLIFLHLLGECTREGGEECFGAGICGQHGRRDCPGKGANIEDKSSFTEGR